MAASPSLARGRDQPRARARPKRALVELAVGAALVCGVSGAGLHLHAAYARDAGDTAAQADLRNAVDVLTSCSDEGPIFPLGHLTVTRDLPAAACPGQFLRVSTGTTLTYVPTDGASYVLLANNSGGRPTFYCANGATGGSIRTVAPTAESC